MDNLNVKQKLILIVIAIGMLISIGYYFMNYFGREEQNYEYFAELNTIQDAEEIEVREIKVHIAGCVAEEGIVTLKEGERIADAIEKAGGLTSDANIKDVNLAYILKDGQKLYIPSNIEEECVYVTSQNGEEIISTGVNETESEGGDGKVNINTASQTELETLSGIGPSTALKIIQYREENGGFSDVEELKNVPGIGEAKYEQILSYIEI